MKKIFISLVSLLVFTSCVLHVYRFTSTNYNNDKISIKANLVDEQKENSPLNYIWIYDKRSKTDNHHSVKILSLTIRIVDSKNKEYLIKNLNSKHHKIISWILYGLKEKHYRSESIENALIHKLSQFGEKSYIYNEIIAFLISISSKKVIPYIEKTLFTQSKIDDEIYTELKNNLSDEFAELRKQLLGEFK